MQIFFLYFACPAPHKFSNGLSLKQYWCDVFLIIIFCFLKGGHTTEMMRLLGSLSSYYQPRIYIVAETDKMSVEKITTFEKEKTKRGGSEVGIDKSL